ncbi:hypothetical protein NPIL_228851 [Nephila pilipes]|uniref:Uncharacterized protein n=1 Tax=Nephila pilipes TaxID=299642 RepID=A0A8X6P4C9_NEPPI|nr:hypothetical protein NPIL_228851 [Nephila pilipes]
MFGSEYACELFEPSPRFPPPTFGPCRRTVPSQQRNYMPSPSITLTNSYSSRFHSVSASKKGKNGEWFSDIPDIQNYEKRFLIRHRKRT